MKFTELRNHTVMARKMPTPNGAKEMFEMAFEDRDGGDVILIRFNKDARDAIVRELTSGIVLAGGELPRL